MSITVTALSVWRALPLVSVLPSIRPSSGKRPCSPLILKCALKSVMVLLSAAKRRAPPTTWKACSQSGWLRRRPGSSGSPPASPAPSRQSLARVSKSMNTLSGCRARKVILLSGRPGLAPAPATGRCDSAPAARSARRPAAPARSPLRNSAALPSSTSRPPARSARRLRLRSHPRHRQRQRHAVAAVELGQDAGHPADAVGHQRAVPFGAPLDVARQRARRHAALIANTRRPRRRRALPARSGSDRYRTMRRRRMAWAAREVSGRSGRTSPARSTRTARHASGAGFRSTAAAAADRTCPVRGKRSAPA